MIGELPVSLCIDGVEHEIRTDYRDILNILVASNDPDLKENEKMVVALTIFYKNIDFINDSNIEEAVMEMNRFIDCGEDEEENARTGIRLFDWEQDEQIIFSAVNKVAGHEVRQDEYLHWWSFIAYFCEIGEGTFATIVAIRDKKKRGKRLDGFEKRFYRQNMAKVNLKKKYSKEQQDEMDRINKMFE
ncbi:MAG: bacteriophage Gp15 family protein [Roseburia sp.]|nr:bacteriophage Gp15 family protein [Roseburia sp.]